MNLSPQDKVERVLKEIHIAFASAETFGDQPDKVVVDRREFLALLDRLNQGIYGMMDQYEQTRQSRDIAERAFRRKSDEIIEDANASAEDIYAASIVYTADMLNRIRDLMDKTNESMNDMFREFRKSLREEKDTVRAHEMELQSQLSELSDSKLYLNMIRDMKTKKLNQNRERDLEKEREQGRKYAQTMFGAKPSTPEVKVNPDYFEKTGKKAEGASEKETPAEKPEIHINKDAAYFKWKAGQIKNELADQPISPDDGADLADEENPGLLTPEEMAEVDELLGEEKTDSQHPDEEAIRQAVLEDEMAMEYAGELGSIKAENKAKGAGLLRNILLGKD